MRQIKFFLVLVCIEGAIAFLAAFYHPTNSHDPIFLWFSASQLIVLTCILGLCLLSSIVTVWVWRSTSLTELLQKSLDQWCLEKKRLAASVVAVFAVSLIGFAAILFVLSTKIENGINPPWAPDTFSVLYAVVERPLPLLLWGLIFFLELGAFLVLRYLAQIKSREFWSWPYLEGTCLVLLILTITIFHWTVLIFQLRFFANNRAWYWTIAPKPFTIHDLWFTAIVLLFAGLAYWILILSRPLATGLLIVFLLGLFLQVGIEFTVGSGLQSLHDKYFSTYHRVYPLAASQNHLTLLENIRRYEDLYATHSFTNTKPPGLIASYIILERMVNGTAATYPDDIRFERFSWAITYSFPISSMLMVFLIYAFTKRFVKSPSGLTPLMAPLLFVVCPNIILFALFPDQAIYPLAFLLCIWSIVIIIRQQSFLWAFVLGMLLYAAVFFAFTLLPLYPFVGIFLVLDYWIGRRTRSVGRELGMLLCIGAGTVFFYFVFLGFFNYDFFPRFARTVEINHNFDFYLRLRHKLPNGPETLSIKIHQIVGAAWINNLDFAAGVGFPIYILFVVHGIRILLSLLKGNASNYDVVLITFFLSYVVLNFAGTTQGEVARLWMFWVPLVVASAAVELERFVQKNPRLFLVLILLQIGTILLTYHYQDLRM